MTASFYIGIIHNKVAWAFGAALTTEKAEGIFTCDLDLAEAIAAMEYVKSLKWEYCCC